MASARADGEAGARDLALLDEHLGSCASCRDFVATADRVQQVLAVGGVRGAPDVTAAVLHRIRTDHAGDVRRAQPRRSRAGRGRRASAIQAAGRRARGGSPLVVTAAIVLVVAVAATAFWAGRGSQPEVSVATQAGPPPGDGPRSSPRAWTGPRAVVWSRDQVGPDVLAAVESVPAVERTSVVARATVGLLASRAADGAVVDEPGPGWSIPIDTVAVDPATYGPLIGGPDAATLRRLRPGQAILGASSARLRGLGVGAELDVEDQKLEVVAVVEDRAVGAAEVAVDRETGARLGLSVDRYVVVGYRGPPDALVDAVVAATGVPTRVRDEDDTPFLRNGDAVLPQVQVKERYGEFATRVGGEDVEVDPAWWAAELERADLPRLGPVTCHRRLLAALRAVLDDLAAEGLADLVSPDRVQGCWNPKEVRATGDLSHHTWGVAIDLAPIVVDGARTQDLRLVAAFERHGFTWGGTWLVPDPEHFELLAPPPS